MENKTLELKLDKAAYFILKGATLLEVTGKYGQNRFTVGVTPQVYQAIDEQPLVNYKKYMQQRIKLKEKTYKLNGIVKVKKGDFGKQKIKKLFENA